MPPRLHHDGSGSTIGYRGDIDGLRAISIVVVVLFHAGVDRFAGGYVGVDVFFVISGFLITGLLVREIERSGRVSMRDFYARRIRRLLPLSFLTIIATLAAGLWLLPPVAREALVADTRAAALYVANWRYAAQTTAYSDAQVTDSLLVHYWSLAIEEQFYVLWPVLIVSGLGISRLVRRPHTLVLGGLLGTLGIVSLALSITITNHEGVGAYYLTHTRLWEMAAGAGLALTIHRIPKLPTITLDVAGAIGLILIGIAAVSFDATTPFPGSAALLPVVGCAAVLVAGSQQPGAIASVLATAPLRLIGRLSYAWYLLHWPSIGIGLLLRERYGWSWSIGATTAAAVIGSLGLSWVLHHTIENPVRRADVLRNRRGTNYAMGAALTLAPVLLGIALIANVDRGDDNVVFQGVDGPLQLSQTPVEAMNDAVHGDSSCHSNFSETVPADDCIFGDPNGAVTIVLLGDSHARQWLDALDLLGREEGWKVHAWTKSACSIVDADVYLTAQERPYDECKEWRAAVTDVVAELEDVDLVLLARAGTYLQRVVIGGAIASTDDALDHWRDAYIRTAHTFDALANEVVLVADTPWPGFSPPECLSGRPEDVRDCSFDRDTARRDLAMLEVERPISDDLGIRIVDPVPLVCPEDPCPVVTPEGVITYRDSHHLTRTFSLSLRSAIRSWIPL